MPSITLNHLSISKSTHDAIKLRAQTAGRSTEAEIRLILDAAAQNVIGLRTKRVRRRFMQQAIGLRVKRVQSRRNNEVAIPSIRDTVAQTAQTPRLGSILSAIGREVGGVELVADVPEIASSDRALFE